MNNTEQHRLLPTVPGEYGSLRLTTAGQERRRLPLPMLHVLPSSVFEREGGLYSPGISRREGNGMSVYYLSSSNSPAL